MELDRGILEKLEACRKMWLSHKKFISWENPSTLEAGSKSEDQ